MLWLLFWEFFKIASFVVGGGFAILIVAEDVFVKKYHWLRDGELSDMLALIQTVPGLTAGNIAIYTGYRIAGTAGALLALTGVAMPSFIVITAIAAGFSALPLD
ncbi:MAG: chromate transporter, partial [Victivallaceae bacterium]